MTPLEMQKPSIHTKLNGFSQSLPHILPEFSFLVFLPLLLSSYLFLPFLPAFFIFFLRSILIHFFPFLCFCFSFVPFLNLISWFLFLFIPFCFCSFFSSFTTLFYFSLFNFGFLSFYSFFYYILCFVKPPFVTLFCFLLSVFLHFPFLYCIICVHFRHLVKFYYDVPKYDISVQNFRHVGTRIILDFCVW